jgi:hypothetical protein
MTVMAAIIVLLLLVDVVIAARIVATRSPSPGSSSAPQGVTGHPCNHGDYVSRAAHSKKGGDNVSKVAQSNLGKDGKCAAPLPGSGQAGSTEGSDD